MVKYLVPILLIFLSHLGAYGKITGVPIDNSSTVAFDLTHPTLGHMLPEEIEDYFSSLDIQTEKDDISLWEPMLSKFYVGEDTFDEYKNDQKIPAEDGEEFAFIEVVSSEDGVMRFNVSNIDGKLFQVTITRRLHTTLLRKNLFRKLGYSIPSSKWLDNIKLNFKDNDSRDFFKDLQILANTSRDGDRWIREVKEKSLIIQDVVVKDIETAKIADISLSAPPEKFEDRSLRATLVPYSFVAINESINAFSRSMTKMYDGEYIFKHFQEKSSFNASLDDIKWIARKLAKLTQEDLHEVIKYSYFPFPINDILLEKLVQRRNRLMDMIVLKVDPLREYFAQHPKYKNGFLEDIDFPNYATHFTSDPMESPLDDLLSFGIAKSQESIIRGAVSQLNSQISVFDVTEKRTQWIKEDFEANKDFAIDYYVKNGEFPELPFSTWFTPRVNGGLLLGRNVVIGPSLGTDNLVQMADSFGYTYSYGGILGLERVIDQSISGSFSLTNQHLVSFNHIKPLSKIKDVFSTSYKNILVGLYNKKIKKRLETAIKSEQEDEELRQKVVHGVMDYIDEKFKVGESLIISESEIPTMNLGLSAPVNGAFVVTGKLGYRKKDLKRIHIHRRSKNHIQVYFDDAKLRELLTGLKISNLIPFFDYEGNKLTGDYKIKLFDLNLDRNLKTNKTFFRDIKALFHIMEDRNLSKVDIEPVTITNTVSDKLSQLNLLFLSSKELTQYADMSVEQKDFDDTKYLYSFYGKQSGLNYIDLGKRILNYVLGEFLSEIELYLTPNPHEPAHRTVKGSSKTISTEFQAKYIDITKNGLENFSNKYLVTSYVREGNTLSFDKLKSLLGKVNDETGLAIFSDGDEKDIGELKLYKIETKIHFYEKAVDKLLFLTDEEIDNLSSRRKKDNEYNRTCDSSATIGKKLSCGNFDQLKRLLKNCHSRMSDKKYKKANKCFAKYMYHVSKYNDIKDLFDLVGLKNVFVETKVNGFRQDKETIYRPFNGVTYGRVNAINKDGPIDGIIKKFSLLKGELFGSWLRYRF